MAMAGSVRPVLAFGVAVFLGLLAAFAPSWSAYRARVTEMLRPV